LLIELREDRSRALIQMATGSGKTFTAANLCDRLIRHADAKRILFLVDRFNLGKQTRLESSRPGLSSEPKVLPAVGRLFVWARQRTCGGGDPVGRLLCNTSKSIIETARAATIARLGCFSAPAT